MTQSPDARMLPNSGTPSCLFGSCKPLLGGGRLAELVHTEISKLFGSGFILKLEDAGPSVEDKDELLAPLGVPGSVRVAGRVPKDGPSARPRNSKVLAEVLVEVSDRRMICGQASRR